MTELLSLRDLWKRYGVTLTVDLASGEDQSVLLVHLPDGTDEVWRPAPDGYPLDGSRELMRVDGRYYVPEGR